MVDEVQAAASEEGPSGLSAEAEPDTAAAETEAIIPKDRAGVADEAYDAMAAVDPEAAAALRQEWGESFETNLLAAQAAASTLADEDPVALFEENGLGDDPRIIRAAARIGHLIADQAPDGRAGSEKPDHSVLEAELDDLARSPHYWSEDIQRRVREIHHKLYGNTSIGVHRGIGDAGRR